MADQTELSSEEIQRYSRHLLIPEVGLDGQKRLKDARVLLVGTGGLGSPAALYLAAAGVGTLGLVDFDAVDFSNLHRQIIHGTGDVDRPKIDSAISTLSDINSNIELIPHETRLTSENALDIIKDYDMVVDGTDNFPTRYLVNDACVLLGKPNVFGCIFRFEGQASVFDAANGPCYRCLFSEPPPPGMVPSCAEAGVLGVLPGIIGVIQATEAVKLIIGQGTSLRGRLLLYDALQMSFRELKIRKDPECPVCGENPSITELIDYEQFCGIGAEEEADEMDELSVSELKAELDEGRDLVLLDVREEFELDICKLDYTHFIPVGQIEARLDELDKDADIVVYCRSGMRSANAQAVMLANGFTKVRNLAGGILAWAAQIDPEMDQY